MATHYNILSKDAWAQIQSEAAYLLPPGLKAEWDALPVKAFERDIDGQRQVAVESGGWERLRAFVHERAPEAMLASLRDMRLSTWVMVAEGWSMEFFPDDILIVVPDDAGEGPAAPGMR